MLQTRLSECSHFFLARARITAPHQHSASSSGGNGDTFEDTDPLSRGVDLRSATMKSALRTQQHRPHPRPVGMVGRLQSRHSQSKCGGECKHAEMMYSHGSCSNMESTGLPSGSSWRRSSNTGCRWAMKALGFDVFTGI